MPAPCAAPWAQPCALPGSCLTAPLSLPCAFQVLECLDLNECGENVLEIMKRHLKSQSREMRRLVLRGLAVLSKDPSMVRRRQQLKLCWQRGAGERSRLGLAGLRALRQLFPALLPPGSAARVLRDRPLASGPYCSRVALHSLVFHTGQKNVQPDQKPWTPTVGC